jgi:hypothetical protein
VTASGRAPSKKSFSSVSAPIFACSNFVDGGLHHSVAAAAAKNMGSSTLELCFQDVI